MKEKTFGELKIGDKIYTFNITDKELDLIKKVLSIKGELDKYVILCEDEQGRYIKYAFIEGEPHDNRCLSWYPLCCLHFSGSAQQSGAHSQVCFRAVQWYSSGSL